MTQTAPDWGLETTALRARLAKLAEQHSQSDIARRTGTSVANVSRYLKGTRMPAEFCAALVKQMGVNPAWLLAGEGTPLVSDITAGTTSMAGDLLQLVDAMNAVSQMRLGALTGKHHLRVLRELNEALLTYEKLRERLNTHSVPLFKQLLGDLARVLDRFEIHKAAELFKAAEQVARLCDEPQLQRELLALQAQYQTFNGDNNAAAEYQRRMILHPLSRGHIVDEQTLVACFRLALNLHALQRRQEALQVCEAAAILQPAAATQWPAHPMLHFMRGRLKAELGDLVEGIAIMMRELPLPTKPRQDALRVWVMTHLLRGGMLRFEDAFAFGDDNGVKAMILMHFACWLETIDAVKRANNFALGRHAEKLGELERPALYGPFLQRALEHKDRRAPAEFAKIAGRSGDEFAQHPEVYLTQLWRVIGDKKQCRNAYAAACKKLAALPLGVSVDLLVQGLHHRNGLWLGQDTAAATDFFKRYADRGFQCFKGVAAESL